MFKVFDVAGCSGSVLGWSRYVPGRHIQIVLPNCTKIGPKYGKKSLKKSGKFLSKTNVSTTIYDYFSLSGNKSSLRLQKTVSFLSFAVTWRHRSVRYFVLRHIHIWNWSLQEASGSSCRLGAPYPFPLVEKRNV